MAERAQRSPEFEDHINRIEQLLTRIEAQGFANVEAAARAISELLHDLDQAYRIAVRTPQTDDDAAILNLENRALATVEEKIDVLPGTAQNIKDSLRTYANLLVQINKSIAIRPYTPHQVKTVRTGLDQLRTILPQLSGLPGGDSIVAAIGSLRNEIDRTKILTSQTLLPDLDNVNLSPLIRQINPAAFTEPGDQERVSRWLNTIRSAAGNVSNVENSPPEKLDPEQEKELVNALRGIRSLYSVYSGNEAATNELKKLEQLTHEILHEHRVMEVGGSFSPNRQFLRPSRRRDVPESIDDGTVDMFIGNFASQLERAEAIGRVLTAVSPADRHNRVSDEDREFLNRFRRDVNAYVQRQILNLQNEDMDDPDNQQYLDDFIEYTERYLQWLDLLIASTVPPSAARVAGREGAASTPDMENFRKQSWHSFINNLVTNEYKEDQFPTWDLVKEEKLEAVNMPALAEIVNMVRACHAFGVFRLESFNMGYLTVKRNERLRGVLANSEAMSAWDGFRASDLYIEVVEKISDRAAEKMNGTGKWSAANGWVNGWDLIQESAAEIYTSDIAVQNALLAAFPPGMPVDLQEDIKAMLARLAHYDVALRDRRQKSAVRHLGLRRKAFKHDDGSQVGVAGRLAQISYKVGKNDDKGLYSSDLGWVELPDEYLVVPALPPSPTPEQIDDVKNVEEQVERFTDRQHTIEAFFNIDFDNHPIVSLLREKRWKPRSPFPIPLFLDDFLTSPDRNGEGPDRKRNGQDNIAAFTQSDVDLETIYNQASKCWTQPEMESFSKMNDTKFENDISDKIAQLGTNISKALAYTNFLDADAKIEYFESMRAAIDFYIIYLFGQLEFDFRNGLPQPKYGRRYDILQRALSSYFEHNDSLFLSYIPPGEIRPVQLNKRIISTINDPRLRKNANVLSAIGRTRRIEHFNLEEARTRAKIKGLGDRIGFDLGADLKEIGHEPHWPYSQKSNTSSKESEQGK